MKKKFIRAHIKVAHEYAKLSCCNRKVGCIIVKDNCVISIGYNGTPPGWKNVCEDSDGGTNNDDVIHAEENAVAKLAKSTESGEGAVVFCTHAPCKNCARLLANVGIKELYYVAMTTNHRWQGIEHLNKCHIRAIQVREQEKEEQGAMNVPTRIGRWYRDRLYQFRGPLRLRRLEIDV